LSRKYKLIFHLQNYFNFYSNNESNGANDLNSLYQNGNGHTPGVSDKPTAVEKDILVRLN